MNEKTNYKNIARFSWNVWKNQKGKIPFILFGFASAAVIDTLLPVITGKLVNEINAASKGEAAWSDIILVSFVLFVGVELVYHTVRNGTVHFYAGFASKAMRSILDNSFAKVQKFSTDWHANAFAGGTVRKITRGMWAFDVFEDNVIMFLWPTLIVVISTVTIMWVKWPLLGIVTLATTLLYIAFTVWAVMKINAPKFRKSAEADTKVGAALADAITGNAAVKAFGNEHSEESRFGLVTHNWRTLSQKAWRTGNAMDLLRRYLSLTMMGMMVGTAIHLWTKGVATPGDVVFALTSYLVLSAYLKNIGEQMSNLQRAMAEMEDVVGFWMREDDITDAPSARPLVANKGEIAFDNVRFSYANKDETIYDDFTVTVSPGEKIALVGHSGSGKSTFVKLVQRLYDVQGGEIRIDGQNVRDVTQESLRRAIALVPQEPILFHRSIATNIAYAKPEASMEEIIEAAKRAYAHDFIETLPHGYETLVGERGVKLSGGERQRVAIARAVLADAPILILDEATSSLDSLSEHYIQKAMAGLMEGRTTITIAHRLATIKAVDRILVFDNGKIVEQGRHSDLIHRPDSYYKRLYEMQALDLIGNEEDVLAAE